MICGVFEREFCEGDGVNVEGRVTGTRYKGEFSSFCRKIPVSTISTLKTAAIKHEI